MILEGFKVLAEVQNERTRQDAIWGGAQHDDTHSRLDWLMILDHYQNKLLRSPSEYRKTLLDIAAVSVAAMEAYDRNNSIPLDTSNVASNGNAQPDSGV